ncbi:MAG: hypothetical protein PUA56_01525 [Bacillales bacterium]|nr:hypothetical protein [Bacillales bacterium]
MSKIRKAQVILTSIILVGLVLLLVLDAYFNFNNEAQVTVLDCLKFLVLGSSDFGEYMINFVLTSLFLSPIVFFSLLLIYEVKDFRKMIFTFSLIGMICILCWVIIKSNQLYIGHYLLMISVANFVLSCISLRKKKIVTYTEA